MSTLSHLVLSSLIPCPYPLTVTSTSTFTMQVSLLYMRSYSPCDKNYRKRSTCLQDMRHCVQNSVQKTGWQNSQSVRGSCVNIPDFVFFIYEMYITFRRHIGGVSHCRIVTPLDMRRTFFVFFLSFPFFRYLSFSLFLRRLTHTHTHSVSLSILPLSPTHMHAHTHITSPFADGDSRPLPLSSGGHQTRHQPWTVQYQVQTQLRVRKTLNNMALLLLEC